MSEPSILARLDGVKPRGSGWQARCPAHDDRQPSLSIDPGRDGATLLCCHAGCETEAIVQAVGMSMADLMPPRDQSQAVRTRRPATARPRITATFDYRDAQGKLLYSVVRLEPKGFRQRRPDGRSGWIYNLDGVERVLYRLPELRGAIARGEPVFVPEGEKDVEALREQGLCATCNSGGAGKWADGYSDTLAGADVILIPDNDAPGRQHAAIVGAALNGRARRVRVLELPDLAEKGDVSDWLAIRGHDRGELLRLADCAPEFADWRNAQQAHVGEGSETAEFKLTDLGNAERLAFRHGEQLRYSYERQAWLAWCGQRWEWRQDRAEALAAETVRSMAADAGATGNEELRRHATRSESNSRRRAMLESATHKLRLCEPLDSDPWLLCCANGTLDLRTGMIRPHAAADFMTRATGVAFRPEAKSELWHQFLATVTGGDPELEGFLRRAVGYSLTGDTREERFFFVHGEGGSGKSTFLEAVKAALGEYALTADFETFLARQQVGGVRTDVARMDGARFVASIEVDAGKQLAAGLLKLLTGGDMVTARPLYQTERTFRPAFTLWLCANDAPTVRDDDAALWRRMLRVPFSHVVPADAMDRTLKRRLQEPEQLEAILAWAVLGCIEWQQIGLAVPEAVRAATESYRQEMDPLAEWLEECCELNADKWAATEALFASFSDWAKSHRREPLTERVFRRRLGDARYGLTAQRRGAAGDRGLAGIALRGGDPAAG